jgi:RNA recognition motif-containing protein
MPRLFVGGLPYTTTEEELKALFAQSGAVDSVTIVTDRYTGRSRGFGFVEMPSAEEAQAAIRRLNGQQVGGRTITVNEARARDDRSTRDRGAGGPRRGGRW